MTSYNHDADVVVFNYDSRATDYPVNQPLTVDLLATTAFSLREAIISIQCSKTKEAPQGTFMITLKATQEWTSVIVPGSWCAIYMSNSRLTKEDLTAEVTLDLETDNAYSPLKMIGIIMSVRMQKSISGDGAVTVTYTLSGYDFGYIFLNSVHINHINQSDVLTGKYDAAFKEFEFPKDEAAWGDPARNLDFVLRAISKVDNSTLGIGSSTEVTPPSSKIVLPKAVTSLFKTGSEPLQFIAAAIGVDNRTNKAMSFDFAKNRCKEFEPKLVGEKRFMLQSLIVDSTYWSMINQYLNPILNEAYCDLHVELSIPKKPSLRPVLVARQIPFNTPEYKLIQPSTAFGTKPYSYTIFTDLPKTTIPAHKVIGYEIGYSEYDRCNFVEVTSYSIDLDASSKDAGAFNVLNKPSAAPGSVGRFGLKPKLLYGVDYGWSLTKLDTAAAWRPLLQDWFFNAHRYVNGTIECIGLLEHIAIGENVLLEQEKILGHIESYTHNFTVDPELGTKIFRTTIEFSRGISSDSTSSLFKFVHGDTTATEPVASVLPKIEKTELEKTVDNLMPYKLD